MPISAPPSVPGVSALFLDRDGTVIEDRHYLSDPAGVTLLPGAGQALGRLCAAGTRLFLVTNQSGVGRGYFDAEAVRRCQARLEELLLPFGARLTAMRYCPHAPEAHCACRKPAVGMWQSLAEEFGLRPEQCAMVGDKPEDMRFGAAAGFAAAFLTLTGKGPDSAQNWGLSLPEGQDALPVVGVPDSLPAPAPTRPAGDDGPAARSTLCGRTALWLARDLNAVASVLLP